MDERVRAILLAEPRVRIYFQKKQLPPHCVEDLTQEVLCRALEGLQKFKGKSQLTTWILGISRNVLYQYFNQKTKFLVQDMGKESYRDMFIDRIEWDMIVDILPQHLKIIYERKYKKGMTIKEISLDLELPQGTVKYYLFLIRSKLRREI